MEGKKLQDELKKMPALLILSVSAKESFLFYFSSIGNHRISSALDLFTVSEAILVGRQTLLKLQ